jgi:LmeA-like phospholipid-binding
VSHYPTGPVPVQTAPSNRRRSRGWLIALIVLLVLAGILAVGDRVAAAYTEGRIAQQIQDQGFNAKPNVSIQGFPFLTQLAGRDFHTVNINANQVTEGPVQIRTLRATLHDVRINSSFSGGTVDRLNGAALITFASLVHAAGGPAVSASAAGDNKIKFRVDLDIITGTAIAKVTKVGGNKIHVRVISAGGIPTDVLGPLRDFTVSIPSLPMGMSLQRVKVSKQGVEIHITGTHVTFSQ